MRLIYNGGKESDEMFVVILVAIMHEDAYSDYILWNFSPVLQQATKVADIVETLDWYEQYTCGQMAATIRLGNAEHPKKATDITFGNTLLNNIRKLRAPILSGNQL